MPNLGKCRLEVRVPAAAPTYWSETAYSLAKDFPEIALIAIDVIVETLNALKGKTDEKSKSWYYLARNSLEGLKTWRDHGHESIMKRTDAELAKFPPVQGSPF